MIRGLKECKENWERKEIGNTRTKNLVKAYVKMLLSNSQIDYKVLGNIYRPDQAQPEITVRRLLKRDFIQTMIDNELERVLVDNGITQDYATKLLKKAIEIAQVKENPVALLKCVENLQELLGMKGKAVKTTESLEMTNAHLLADNADKAIKERESIKLSRTIEGKE